MRARRAGTLSPFLLWFVARQIRGPLLPEPVSRSWQGNVRARNGHYDPILGPDSSPNRAAGVSLRARDRGYRAPGNRARPKNLRPGNRAG